MSEKKPTSWREVVDRTGDYADECGGPDWLDEGTIDTKTADYKVKSEHLAESLWPSLKVKAANKLVARGLSGFALSERSIACLDRLLSHPEMNLVWAGLLRRNRDTRKLLYPAKLGESSSGSQEIDQCRAMQRLLFISLDAFEHPRRVWKLDELNEQTKRVMEDLTVLRRMTAAYQAEHDSQSSTAHVAGAEEVGAWHQRRLSKFPCAGDPMLVKRYRGNPFTKGIEVTLVEFFKEHFGHTMERTAMTIAAVVEDEGWSRSPTSAVGQV